jgi:hypothetical protein
MSDRNAFLHGQTAPIGDDAGPPEQGWRGERAADEPSEEGAQRRHIPGVSAEVEEVSGIAYAEAKGLGSPADTEPQADDNSHVKDDHSDAASPDGVNDLSMAADRPGGESAGAPYPHGNRKPRNDPGSVMGHGGQTEINYHGTGHLGDTKVGDDNNRNGVAEHED